MTLRQKEESLHQGKILPSSAKEKTCTADLEDTCTVEDKCTRQRIHVLDRGYMYQVENICTLEDTDAVQNTCNTKALPERMRVQKGCASGIPHPFSEFISTACLSVSLGEVLMSVTSQGTIISPEVLFNNNNYLAGNGLGWWGLWVTLSVMGLNRNFR